MVRLRTGASTPRPPVRLPAPFLGLGAERLAYMRQLVPDQVTVPGPPRSFESAALGLAHPTFCRRLWLMRAPLRFARDRGAAR